MKLTKGLKVLLISLLLVVCSLMLGCDMENNSQNKPLPVENGYGKISVNCMGGEDAMTVLPSTVFDKYVYVFTKVGEENGNVITPDDDGSFTL